jgi:hypothetical protein
MTTVSVPVAEPRPVGRIEYAAVGDLIYGVDGVGTVWIIRGGRRVMREAAYRRLARAIVSRRRRSPRHRKVAL